MKKLSSKSKKANTKTKTNTKKTNVKSQNTKKKTIRAKKQQAAIEDPKAQQTNGAKDEQQQKKTNTGGSEAFIQFFYTNDKFMNQFEDKEIIQDIQRKYPLFMKDGSTDSEFKKQIATIIQDKPFFTEILEKYDLKIEDFFRFVFRLGSSVFKGPFIGKLQRLLREGNYLK